MFECLLNNFLQELICGGTAFLEPPLILIQQVPTRRGSLESFTGPQKKASYTLHMPARIMKPQKEVSLKVCFTRILCFEFMLNRC